jgi:hypothetical protein
MKKMNLIILFVIVVLLRNQVGFATVGIAEWELVTPGGYKISHSDPWKDKHGTFLKQKNGDKIYISKIDWWQYYEENIIGKSESNYFIFNENNHHVILIDNEDHFIKKIQKLKLGKPKSKKMLPQDGWDLVWHYSLAKLRTNDNNVDQNQKKMLKETLKLYRGKVYDDGIVVYYIYIEKKK